MIQLIKNSQEATTYARLKYWPQIRWGSVVSIFKTEIILKVWGHNSSYSKKQLCIDRVNSCQEAEHIEILEKWVWKIQIIQIYHFPK